MSTPSIAAGGVTAVYEVFISAVASYAARASEYAARAAARAADELDQRHVPGFADEAHRWHTAAQKLRRGEAR